ncbi:MAG: hypothetical protein HYZ90_05125, partial [Candidatus Omnitrophica bacterium]|nr:hypothetical protein [Candidatus Omnitrophota bacterium]
QGRIEQVINSHPEERRVIFEEAAGITKFKAQKREATRRLDETEANLARVSDVIAEVRRQIQALERQVKRAKAYQEQFEELKRLEIRLARHEEGKLALQRREKEAALEGLRGEMAGFEERFQLKEADLEKGREAAAQADSSFAQARELLLGVKHSQETVQHRIEVTHERIEEGKKRSLQLQEELSGAKEEVRRLRAQHEELNTLLQASGAQRQAKEEEVRRLSEGLERCAAVISGAGEAIARAQGELLSATTLQVQVKNDLNKILQENNRLEARHNRLKNEATKVGAERAEALRQVEELEGRVRAASGALESAGKERTALKEEMDADEAVLSLAREKLSGVDQEITKAASQLELLMGLISSHEGYASGVKALLTAFDQGALSREGVSGVLAELIQVDPKETVAVEASLGSWAQAVVVESDEAADRCRAYLETSRGGRVLFLIVGRVPSDLSGLLSAAASFDGAVPLINRMGITPHLEPLLKLLLADTWLVSGRMPARQFLEQAREKQPAARFVTPAGELFTLAGALLGSAPVEEGLVVGRRSRLQSLEIGLSRLEKSREEARGRVSQLESELKAKEERLQKMEEIFQQHRHELQRLDATFGLAKEGLEKLDQERALLAAEESEAEEELRGLGAQRSRLESDLSEKEGGLSLLQETIQGSQEEISRAAKQREEISVSLATARSELGSFDEILSSRVSSLAVLEQTLNRSTAKISTCQEEIAGLEGSFKEWEKGAEELSASLEGLRREEAVFQERVAEAQARREELLQAAGAKEKELLSFSRAMEQFQSKLHAHEMELAQLSFQREEMRNRLAQVYQVNLEEAPGELNPFSGEAEAASARDQTAELSRRLSRIGPVNLASIDEERELQSRYEYLSTQQNDLLKAKE